MKEMEQLLRQANINYNSAEFLHVHLKVLGDPPHTHTYILEFASWSDCYCREEAESHTPDHHGQERFFFGNFDS